MDGLMGGVMSNHQNQINLDLNEMKLCVKIDDFWRDPHLWMFGLLGGVKPNH